MKLSIAHLRAAGLTDSQIVKVMEEAEAERRGRFREPTRGARGRPNVEVSADAHGRNRPTAERPRHERDIVVMM
jgi:hypothetical protein